MNIAASAPSGYSFAYWNIISGSEYLTLTKVDSPKATVSLTGGDATIQPVISDTLFVLTIGNDGHGTTDPPAGNVTVANGIPRNISATPTDTGYVFDTWVVTSGPVVFGDTTQAATTATVTGGNAEIQARFKIQQYTVSIDSDSNGSTNLSSVILLHGQESATITATANTGYEFSGWTITSGSNVSFNPDVNSSNVKITATGGSAAIKANFIKISYTLNISTSTGGYVNPSGNHSVTYGDPYQLHAYPYGTYVFDH